MTLPLCQRPFCQKLAPVRVGKRVICAEHARIELTPRHCAERILTEQKRMRGGGK